MGWAQNSLQINPAVRPVPGGSNKPPDAWTHQHLPEFLAVLSWQEASDSWYQDPDLMALLASKLLPQLEVQGSPPDWRIYLRTAAQPAECAGPRVCSAASKKHGFQGKHIKTEEPQRHPQVCFGSNQNRCLKNLNTVLENHRYGYLCMSTGLN